MSLGEILKSQHVDLFNMVAGQEPTSNKDKAIVLYVQVGDKVWQAFNEKHGFS